MEAEVDDIIIDYTAKDETPSEEPKAEPEKSEEETKA